MQITAKNPFGSLVALFLVSCGSPTPVADQGHSVLHQITNQEYDCRNWDDGRTSAVREASKTFASEYYNGSRWSEKFYRALSGIPDPYLEFMTERAASPQQFKIFTNPQRKGQSYTSWGRTDVISVDNSNWGFDLSLQHEVGHYVQDYLEDTIAPQRGSSRAEFKRSFNQVAAHNCRNPVLHSYPRSYAEKKGCNSDGYRGEFFAEAFNSYYCSEETNELTKTHFPDVHEFMEKFFIAPVWEGPASTTASGGVRIFIGKERSRGVHEVWLSGNANSAGAAICLGDKKTCSTQFSAGISMQIVQTPIKNRRIFFGNQPLNLNNHNELTIAILNTDGSVAQSRGVVITPK